MLCRILLFTWSFGVPYTDAQSRPQEGTEASSTFQLPLIRFFSSPKKDHKGLLGTNGGLLGTIRDYWGLLWTAGDY